MRATSFAELGRGAIGLVLDSYGMLAVCLDQRSAAEELGLAAGDQITLVPLLDDGTERRRRRRVASAVADG